MQQSVPKMYVLTPLTRGAAAQRRVILQGFDIPWRAFVVGSLAAIPGLLVTLMLWPLAGQYSLIGFGLVEAAAFFLIERRTKDGLQLRTYQSMIDKRRSAVGHWFMCGRRIDPLETLIGVVRINTVPVEVAAVDDVIVSALCVGDRLGVSPPRMVVSPSGRVVSDRIVSSIPGDSDPFEAFLGDTFGGPE